MNWPELKQAYPVCGTNAIWDSVRTEELLSHVEAMAAV